MCTDGLAIADHMIPIAVSRQTGWNTLPKMASSLDTLTAAALASSNSNVNSAVNPLAASHFGGTVGQSNLRPGEAYPEHS